MTDRQSPPMPQDRPTAAVLGLGTVGASLALALRQSRRFGAVVGWDPDFDTARAAQRLRVADRFVRAARDAAGAAAVVFVAVAPGEVQDAFVAIGPHLRPGAVVCSLDESFERAAGLAAAHLPSNVSFISGHPVLWEEVTPDTQPAAALLQRARCSLTPGAGTHPDAIAFLADLVDSLGMESFFVDAREHDAYVAGVSQLPAVLAATLVRVLSREPSWREMSRLAGAEFRQATALADVAPAHHQQALAGTRDHLVRWLEALAGELSDLHDALVDGREPPDFFDSAAETRRRWLVDRRTPSDVAELPDTPAAPKRRFWI